MHVVLKRIASTLPQSLQVSLRRVHFARQIRANKFRADEPEVHILADFVRPGDWVVDVGANVGHYTLALSQLVGDEGRVIALEPIGSTFAVLASNIEVAGANNVTLVNAAATDRMAVLRMDVPRENSTGLDNPYLAQIAPSGRYSVLGLEVDRIVGDRAIRLVKIDAEGHELGVLKGMERILGADNLTLIVEGRDAEVEQYLRGFGFTWRELPGSWNRVFEKATH